MEFKSIRADITPDVAVSIIGIEPGAKSRGVYSQLEINVTMWRGGDVMLFIIGIDTLFITEPLIKSTGEIIKKTFGDVHDDQIILIATHTHFAPSIETHRQELGGDNPEYEAHLIQKIKDVIVALNDKSFAEIELHWLSGASNHLTSNRRRKTRNIKHLFCRFIAMQPNPEGHKREVMDVMSITDRQTKKQLGYIWSFPCHPTNLYDRSLISSEFPGRVREAMRIDDGNTELAVIYFPGLAGDVRAAPIVSPNAMIRFCNQLSWSLPKSYYRFQIEKDYNTWCSSVVKQLRMVLRDSPVTIETNKIKLNRNVYPVKELLGIQSKSISNLTFRYVSFGNDLSMVFISAEPVSEYYDLLLPIIQSKRCFITGYSDEVYGYLPTTKQVEEGGYESTGHFSRFGIVGRFKPEQENTIINCVKRLIQ